jgi:dihydroxy-acid dehydratase
MVDDSELKRRSAESKRAVQPPERGYARLYAQEILGADQGCDFEFLKPR